MVNYKRENEWILLTIGIIIGLVIMFAISIFGVNTSSASFKAGQSSILNNSNYTCWVNDYNFSNETDYKTGVIEGNYSSRFNDVTLQLADYSNNFDSVGSIYFTAPETTMILYPNGSIWLKSGSEGITGEQLAKLEISYNSYLKGFCEGRR